MAYDTAIQTAFHDVGNALAARATQLDDVKAQQADVDAATGRYQLAKMLFRAEIDNFLIALDVEPTPSAPCNP